ncbi:multicopper oxidase domain-containing protein [Actinopolyspora sp. BKK1]|nr:multicopper oxidase domain-containing protein [Actinopolyspora sp. BKK2]NHE78461.1 multicopper oxidase domain-containing protein [Actinopolyspora sp. BKK1]
MLNRRGMIKLATAGGAVAAMPAGNGLAASASTDPAPSKPFTLPMPIPPVLSPKRSLDDVDFYRVHMTETRTEIIPGLQTTVRTYDGTFPSPTIRARRGRPVAIQQINNLDVETAVHLHGGIVAPEHDGHPTDVLAPGASRTYYYPNEQPAAGLWYHDHAHMLSSENVYRGLEASYLLSDENERALPLPSGRYEIPLQIRDARIEKNGTLTYTRAQDRPHMLVNGRERPFFRLEARKYRLRVYNFSIDRLLNLQLADGSPITQIGTDGGLLETPVEQTELRLSAGERADIVVDFSRYTPGSSIVLENTNALSTENADVMRFDVIASREPDPSSVPDRLATLPAVPETTVHRDFELRFDEDARKYVINDKLYDPDRVDVRTRLGNSEIWTITNADTPKPPPNFHLNHNFHTHLAHFRVLERNGVPVGPVEAAMKDVVLVAPGDTVRIALTWGPHTGRYVYHCHQLPHAAEAQMGTIEILP